jgi:hypothetical protein
MKVIVSLTSIPSRFDKLKGIIDALGRQACHEIWLNIPTSYNRFPDWNGLIPDFVNLDSKLKINRCADYGPATKFIGPAMTLDPEDLIVYLDDDTNYDSKLVTNLLKWWNTDRKSAWGLSGFKLVNYFQGKYPRQHGEPVDVLEGYGAVLVKARWIQDALAEFSELSEEAKFADDLIISNLLEKQGVPRRTVFVAECHVGQLQQFAYGFESDALHHQVGGSHTVNYRKILGTLEDKGKSYFTYKCL